MDSRKYMIIDTSKLNTPGMFITSKVSQIIHEGRMWHITFNNSSTVYTYRHQRIRFIKEPEKIDIKEHGIYLHNCRVDNVAEIYRFSDSEYCYFHVIYNDCSEDNYDERDVYVSRTSLDKCDGGVWNYLNQLASEIGIEIENIGNILKFQYDKIDKMRDNVPLARYLGLKEQLDVYELPSDIIYPFSCNASQKNGVENALSNQLSIIQGPPGTGKTQTILNIISNILISGKTVLVVSNNNSAVENVLEKLSSDKIGLGFLVAKLGKKENKEAFIENQPELPDMSDWELPNKAETDERIKEILEIVSKGFEKQNELAELKTELQALKTEKHYNDIYSADLDIDADVLYSADTKALLSLKCAYDILIEKNKKRPGFLFYVKWLFRFGFKIFRLLRKSVYEAVEIIETIYYKERLREINAEITDCESYLRTIELDKNLKLLCDLSLKVLKHTIAVRKKGCERPVFKYEDIKGKSTAFLNAYPVVLSTTYSSKNCINDKMVFDYVIMDEASQVDIATGALALSCATNAVIVGDNKQLPNVIDGRTEQAIGAIENACHVDDKYSYSTHSFLQSCCDVFTEAPQTLLREHYRCHPKIIEFCNQMFYDGELITMTTDNDEKNVISVIRTPEGQHARGHYNQREIDVIEKEVMPNMGEDETFGIITPYRDQAKAINTQLDKDIASTVHKYQGRECDSIIMSMVDNSLGMFADDPNLLNVAVSRAKSKLCVVVTGNEISRNSNVGQLIAYAGYNNFEVSSSNIHSVFDILYKQYTEERLRFESSKKKDIGELSENIIYDALQKCIDKSEMKNIGILCHYPLSRLVVCDTLLTDEENEFVRNNLTHVDFLIYNALTKQPLLCIEVDGWQYHHTDVQQKRDSMKDSVLDKYGLKHIRISTVQTINEEVLLQYLSENIPVC